MIHSAVPQLVKAYLQHRSHPLMADYLLHLVEAKLTSVFCADDSAGSTPIMQKNSTRKTLVFNPKKAH